MWPYELRAHQAPLSIGFSRWEYWNGLPCPPPENLPDPGIEPNSPVAPVLQADSLPPSHQRVHSKYKGLYLDYQFYSIDLCSSLCKYHTVLIPVALELKIGHFILFFSPHYFGYSSSFAFPYKFENKLVYILRKLWDSDRNCVEFIYFFKSFIKEKNPLPCPSPSHPTGSSQCTSPEHPVSCIEPGLETCFTWKYTCFNAILSNHPTLAFSHRVQQSVLYICVSFAVLHIGSLLHSF